MTILTIRTDKPEAEIGLYDNNHQVNTETWQAHRQLAETIHLKIRELLKTAQKDIVDVQSIVVYQGPGSFTGLRIGITVANALADGLAASIVGTTGEAWVSNGIQRLQSGDNDVVVVPEYGALPNITAPRK